MERKKRVCLSLIFLAAGVSVPAQNGTEKAYYTIEQLQQKNGWLDSGNAAGLGSYEEFDFTRAMMAGSYTGGGLRNVYHASQVSDFTLDVESYQRIRHIMLYGHFQFDYEEGKNQSWCSVTNPGSSTLHIGDGTPGNQTRETYFVDGGISIPLVRYFHIGGYFDFAGVSTAKKKDIRNKNNYSQYHISPSMMWNRGNYRFGASYSYGAETEEIEWSVFGDASKYEVFFFQGLWFGPGTQTSGSITGRRFERITNQGALQFEYHTPNIRWFHEVELSSCEQKAYLNVESERGGENRNAEYGYRGQLWATRPLYTHSLQWAASHGFTKSYQNLQQREKLNLVYIYVQYGTLLRYTESDWKGNLSYELSRNKDKNPFKSDWRLRLKGDFMHMEQRFRTYPNIFTQQVNRFLVEAMFEKTFFFNNGMLDAGLTVSYKCGWGTPVAIDEDKNTTGYKYQPELQQREYHYLTASAPGIGGHGRYTFLGKQAARYSTFVGGSVFYQKAFSGVFEQNGRSFAEIVIGMNF